MTVETDPARPLTLAVEDVAEHITPDVALRAAQRAAVAAMDSRTESGRLTIPLDGGWMRLMGAAVPSLGVFGYKEFHLTRQQALRYAVHIFSSEDGSPIGIVDGALLTPLRTAAAATCAAIAFYGDQVQPLALGIIGSGAEAEAGLRAMISALPVGRAFVTSPRESSRQSFAERLTDEVGVDIEPLSSVEEVAGASDAIYVATASKGQIVVEDSALGDAALVLSIGSTLPVQRELSADVLSRAGVVVIDTEDVLYESGDAIAALADGFSASAAISLGDYLTTPVRAPDGRTVYKSIGCAIQDIVLAADALELARTRGLGRYVSPLASIKWNQ